MTVLVIAEGVAILLLGLLVAGLLRSHAEILRKLHDMGASVEGGSEPELNFAPTVQSPSDVSGIGHDLAGTTPSEDAIAVRVSGVRHRTLVAFLSSGCLTCAGFWDAFSGDVTSELGDTRLVIVTKDDSEESPSRIRKLAPSAHPVVMSIDAWADYQVPGSPYFVLVDGPTNRVIGEGSSGTWAQLRNLMGEALDDKRGRKARRKARADATREARADQELMAAGIYPGDPSLYENPEQGGEQ
jgi:hypothetical protein